MSDRTKRLGEQEFGSPDEEMPEIDFSDAELRSLGRGLYRRAGRHGFTLEALRLGLGVTRAALAQKLGCSKTAVSLFEQREDWLVSSLDQYVRALGGTLEFVKRTDSVDGKIDVSPDTVVNLDGNLEVAVVMPSHRYPLISQRRNDFGES